MGTEKKNILTIKVGEHDAYDIHIEENFNGLSEAVKALNPAQKRLCIITDTTGNEVISNVVTLYVE